MIIEKIGEGTTVEEAQENAKKLLNAPETAAAEGDGTIFGANGVVRRGLEKGLNIIKTTGGKVKKIFVK